MEFQNLVEFGQGPKVFTAAIKRALQDNPEKKAAACRRPGKFLESRAQFMIEIIDGIIKRK
jgi:hypothetical protein